MNGLVPDIPRLNTALAEWLACMVIIMATTRRFKLGVTIALSSAFLGLLVILHTIAHLLPLAFWVPMMIMAIVLMLLMIRLLSKASFQEAIIYATRAFILAEFAASLDWQINFFFINHLSISLPHMQFLTLAVIYLIVYSSAFLIERRYRLINAVHIVQIRDITITVAIAALVFLLSNMSFLSPNTPLSGSFASDIFLVRTLFDLCGLIMLYTLQEQRLWMHARLEINAMHAMLNRHHEQYNFSNENIEFLNLHFHDLKNQIAALRDEVSLDKKNEYLEKMDVALQHFGMQFDTGNNSLDILLASKSKQIVDNKINFTCVANGALLNGMETIDLCSIFGNALDNAIESVTQLSDSDKRIVQATVCSKNEFLMLRFENYYENELRFDGRNIATTKKDKRIHGYGIKSIQKTAEKYGGEVQIATQNNWFILCVLIPMQNLQASDIDG